tara:strand:+ start:69 stop:344 length:276 start_codon:yes stop_codon:yes gene_type:complete
MVMTERKEITMNDTYEQMFEKAVNNMMFAIKSDNKLYEWFMNYNPSDGYTFDTHPNTIMISKLVSLDGHSGASFGTCMRKCKKIFEEKKKM